MPSNPLDNLPNMATKREVARYLRCSVATVDGMLRRGVLRYVKLGQDQRSPVRIPADWLREDLGLTPKASARRRRRQADHELASCKARLGIGDES